MITEPEWASIRNLVERMLGQLPQRYFITGKVIKRDSIKKLVWIKELGDQPIPVVGHDYKVKYYDTNNTGIVNVKEVVVHPRTPDIGEKIFVALELGAQNLPRCLGVIQGRGWIISEVEN